jgi:hypothetical protein
MKKLIILAAAVTLVMTSCTKSLSPGEVKVNIIGIVKNSDTQLPIKDVEVKWATGKSFSKTTSDKNGLYAITGIPAGGNYTIIFSKTGFKTLLNTCNAKTSITVIGSEDYNEVVDNDISLDTLSGTFNFTLYKQASNSATPIAAASFPYKIYLDNPYDAVITGTTDVNGYITQSGLPKYGTFTLVVSQTEGANLYETRTQINGTTSSANNIILYPTVSIVDLGLVSSNLLNADGTIVSFFTAPGPINFTFTTGLDTASATHSVIINPSFAGGQIISFSNSDKTLTITPNTLTTFKKNITYTLSIFVTAKNSPNNTYGTKLFTFKTN